MEREKNSTAFFAAISASKASIAAVLALAVKVKASAERLPIVYRWGIGRNSRERVGWTPAVAKMAGCGTKKRKKRNQSRTYGGNGVRHMGKMGSLELHEKRRINF